MRISDWSSDVCSSDLLGPSGCGKTTLLRQIAGFDDPTSGSIRLDGHDMTGVPANRRPTNMVFQSYAIFPHLTVAQNVAYSLRRLRLGAQERDRPEEEAIAQADMAPDANRWRAG